MADDLAKVAALAVTLDDWTPQERTDLATLLGICPWDCDSCHDEDCPCTRMGCKGSGTTFDS